METRMRLNFGLLSYLCIPFNSGGWFMKFKRVTFFIYLSTSHPLMRKCWPNSGISSRIVYNLYGNENFTIQDKCLVTVTNIPDLTTSRCQHDVIGPWFRWKFASFTRPDHVCQPWCLRGLLYDHGCQLCNTELWNLWILRSPKLWFILA